MESFDSSRAVKLERTTKTPLSMLLAPCQSQPPSIIPDLYRHIGGGLAHLNPHMSPTTHGKRRLRVHQLLQALGQLLARLGSKDTCRRQDLRVGPEVLRLVFVDKRLLGEDRVGKRVVQGLAALSIGLANRQGQREDKGRETHIPDVSSVFTGAGRRAGRREKGERSGKDQNKNNPCTVRQSPYRLTTQCRTNRTSLGKHSSRS